MAAVFCLAAAGVVLAGYFHYQGRKAQLEQAVREELSAVVKLKVGEISSWRRERLTDGVVINANEMVASGVIRWFRNPDDGQARRNILAWMRALNGSLDYEDILLLDPEGNVRLSAEERERTLDPALLPAMAAAVGEKEPTISGLYRSEDSGAIRFGVLTPIVAVKPGKPVYAVVLLLVDPYRHFFPLLENWPIANRTAETLLVERRGDDVYYLNEPRQRKEGALSFHLPVDSGRLIAAMAVEGKEGVFEGIDYRGHQVVAGILHVPNSPWRLIAKVDRDDIYEPLADRVRSTIFFTTLALGGLGALFALLWSLQTLQLHAREKQILEDSRDALDRAVRERTEELVKANESLEEKAALLELARDAILSRDIDSRLMYWNRGAELVYGWTREEALGKITHELLETEFPRPLEEILSEVLEEGQWHGELVHHTRSGTPITVESRWVLQRSADGSPSAILEINRDISERKAAEAALRDYASKLERSNRVLQEFAFVASHDLQEPLRKISTFGDRLRSRYAEVLGESGLDYLARMQSATERMQELVDSLLVYSRVTTKAEPFVQVDLRELVQEVLRDLEIPIQETGATVEVGELPTLQVDPGQMRQLFQNLIGNAVKFHKEDERPVVKVHAEECWDGVCRILVEDNGIGLDEKYSEKIFAPFQRLHGRGSPYRGSGMGLAICLRIVERHNGEISVRSKPGEGAAFIVALPVRHSEGEPRERGPAG